MHPRKRFGKSNRYGNEYSNRTHHGVQQQRGREASGRFGNEGRCFIFNILGYFRAEFPMLEEAVKIKAEKESKGPKSICCDLCDGQHRFSQCPEVSLCKAELKQALMKKNPKSDSTK